MQINTDNEVYKDGFPVGKLNEKGEVEYFDEKPKEKGIKESIKGKLGFSKKEEPEEEFN